MTSRTRIGRRAGALLLTIGALGATAASAQAATSITAEGGALVLRAAPGAANFISFGPSTEVPGLISFDDTAGFQYDAGLCQPEFGQYSTFVVCQPQPGGVVVEAGDGKDVVNTGDLPASMPITVHAGPGDDVVRGAAFGERGETIYGDDGADKLEGGLGNDVIDGGPGDDPKLEGHGGADVVRGGDGNDTLLGDAHNTPAAPDVLDGGPGYDQIEGDWSVDVGQHQPHVTVSEDGQANDGRPGEDDNVGAIERIYLNHPATFVGDDEADEYTVFNTDETPSRLIGNGGNDKLSAFDYDDTVDGGAGSDTLTGGYGNDTITGGPGRDTIYADVSSTTCSYIQCRLPQGNDTVQARDGEADQIDCGVGTDTAYVDAVDTVGTSCETVVKDGPVGPKDGGDGSALSAKARRTSLRKALAKGFMLDVAAPAAGRVKVVAKASKRIVATGKATARGAGKVAVKVRFTKQGRTALRRARKAKLSIKITLTPAQGAAITGRASATLAR
ncbi:MAG TPA: calcium-binding protein [Solirubrobacteraceae bacterium]|nr:calcium-binding protein [Solirubrobacteraceae bacterium]